MVMKLDAEVLYGLSKNIFIESISTPKGTRKSRLKTNIYLCFYIHVLIIENEKKIIRHKPIYVPYTCPIQLKPTNISPPTPIQYLRTLTQR